MRGSVTVAVLAALATTALGGCAGRAEPLVEMQQAVEATRKAGTLRFSFERTSLVADAKPMRGEGVADLASGNQVLTFTGDGTQGGEFRQVGGTVYSPSAPGLPAEAEGKWLALDTPPSLPEFRQLFEAPGGLPLSVVTDGRGLTEVRRGASERVRGVATTRYTAALEPFDAFPPQTPSLMGADQQRAALDGSLDVWVDSDGLVRRARVRVVRAPDGGPAPVTPYVHTVEFWDFGKAEPVEAPPADRVVTERELAEMLGVDTGQP